jgi:16S rRNA U516 pseudouridylate synthase RsuA-like enzyme
MALTTRASPSAWASSAFAHDVRRNAGITSGWVKVDGVVVDTLGTRVSPDARIDIEPAAREYQSGQVTILLHKPVGHVSGQAEDGYEPRGDSILIYKIGSRSAHFPQASSMRSRSVSTCAETFETC